MAKRARRNFENYEIKEIKLIKEGKWYTLYINDEHFGTGNLEDMLEALEDDIKYYKENGEAQQAV